MQPRRNPMILDTAIGIAAAMGAGGMMMGGARLERPVEIEPEPARYYPPKVEAKLVYHRDGHKANREERRRARAANLADQERINKMSNWQRTQWARAGYPKDRIDEFAALVRPHKINLVIAHMVGSS